LTNDDIPSTFKKPELLQQSSFSPFCLFFLSSSKNPCEPLKQFCMRSGILDDP
jgi:hypothetical protein